MAHILQLVVTPNAFEAFRSIVQPRRDILKYNERDFTINLLSSLKVLKYLWNSPILAVVGVESYGKLLENIFISYIYIELNARFDFL